MCGRQLTWGVLKTRYWCCLQRCWKWLNFNQTKGCSQFCWSSWQSCPFKSQPSCFQRLKRHSMQWEFLNSRKMMMQSFYHNGKTCCKSSVLITVLNRRWSRKRWRMLSCLKHSSRTKWCLIRKLVCWQWFVRLRTRQDGHKCTCLICGSRSNAAVPSSEAHSMQLTMWRRLKVWIWRRKTWWKLSSRRAWSRVWEEKGRTRTRKLSGWERMLRVLLLRRVLVRWL